MEPHVLGDLVIDYSLRCVSTGDRPVKLMAVDCWLLAELASNARRVLTYEHLLRRVWQLEPDADPPLSRATHD